MIARKLYVAAAIAAVTACIGYFVALAPRSGRVPVAQSEKITSNGEMSSGDLTSFDDEFRQTLDADELAVVQKASSPESSHILAASFCLASGTTLNPHARDAVLNYLQNRNEPARPAGSKAPDMDANLVSALGALAQAGAKYGSPITDSRPVRELATRYTGREDLVERTVAAMVLWTILAEAGTKDSELEQAYKKAAENPALRSLLERQVSFLGQYRTKMKLPPLTYDGLSTSEAKK